MLADFTEFQTAAIAALQKRMVISESNMKQFLTRVGKYACVSCTYTRIYRRIYVSMLKLPCIYAKIHAYTAGVYGSRVASGK